MKMLSSVKQVAVAALLGLSAGAVSAATVTFSLDYMATNLKGNFATASGGTAVPVGTLVLTDLSDLHLGDGQTGVRSTLSLPGLNQFSSGVGSVFIASYELNFPGTETLSNSNWRNVSGLGVTNIEWEENGTTGTAPNRWTPWLQEINFAAGSFVNGTTSTIDFLNGGGYDGFTVAALLGNPVENTNATLPDAYVWIRIRSTGQGIATGSNGKWWEPATFNAAGGRLDVLSVTPVPEPGTYAMLIAGLGLIALAARRRFPAG